MSKRQASRQLGRSDVEGEEKEASPKDDDRRVKARKTAGAEDVTAAVPESTDDSFETGNSGGGSIFGGLSGLSEANSTKEASSGGLFAGLSTAPTSSGNGFVLNPAGNSNGFALNSDNPTKNLQFRFSTIAQQSPKLTPEKEGTAENDLPEKTAKTCISDKNLFKRSRTPEFGIPTGTKTDAKSIFANVGLKGDTTTGSTNLFGNYGSPPQKGTNAFALSADSGTSNNFFSLGKPADASKTDDLTVPPSALQTPSLYAHQKKSPPPLNEEDEEDEKEEEEKVANPKEFEGGDQQTNLFQFDKADLKKLSAAESTVPANSPTGAPAFGLQSDLGKTEKKETGNGEAKKVDTGEQATMRWSDPIPGMAQLNKNNESGLICIHFWMKSTHKLLLNTPLWVCKNFIPKGAKTVEFLAYDAEQQKLVGTQLKLGDSEHRDEFLKLVEKLIDDERKKHDRVSKSPSPKKS